MDIKSQKFWIEILDPVESLMSPALSEIVAPELSYKAVFYKPGPFHKTRKEYTKSTITKTKDGHLFYTGFIPRIVKICEKEDIQIYGDLSSAMGGEYVVDFSLPAGMEYRPFQKELIKTALFKGRGVLKAPTGTGKTFLGLSLIYTLQKQASGVLWLCHTKDLMSQTAKEAEKFFPRQVGCIGDSSCITEKFLTVATRQSFIKLVDDLGTAYDVVIVDETHHVSSFLGAYPEILAKVMAPIRIGLTATTRTEQESLLAMEAFIGPVIGEFTIDEGREQGYMAHPKIRLIKLTKNQTVNELRKYDEVYEAGVVRNLERNRIIMQCVKEYSEAGKSNLIVVNKITHGRLLQSLMQHNGIESVFVEGSTDTESRDLAKKYLNERNLKCVICTTVWKEGINIPELDVVINAAGGRSELVTLQSIGRGLRRTATKEELIIVDFFDPSHRFLIEHLGYRLTLYMDMKWL